MRFITAKKDKLIEGDTKEINKFLFIPMCLNNEWRWLERACVKQIVMRLHALVPEGACHSPGNTYLEWVCVEWATNEETPHS